MYRTCTTRGFLLVSVHLVMAIAVSSLPMASPSSHVISAILWPKLMQACLMAGILPMARLLHISTSIYLGALCHPLYSSRKQRNWHTDLGHKILAQYVNIRIQFVQQEISTTTAIFVTFACLPMPKRLELGIKNFYRTLAPRNYIFNVKPFKILSLVSRLQQCFVS